VILCRMYVRRLWRCFLNILATLTTGVSRHRAPQAYQRWKKVAALSVQVYRQNHRNSWPGLEILIQSI
jgi:hypothetical protein